MFNGNHGFIFHFLNLLFSKDPIFPEVLFHLQQRIFFSPFLYFLLFPIRLFITFGMATEAIGFGFNQHRAFPGSGIAQRFRNGIVNIKKIDRALPELIERAEAGIEIEVELADGTDAAAEKAGANR